MKTISDIKLAVATGTATAEDVEVTLAYLDAADQASKATALQLTAAQDQNAKLQAEHDELKKSASVQELDLLRTSLTHQRQADVAIALRAKIESQRDTTGLEPAQLIGSDEVQPG